MYWRKLTPSLLIMLGDLPGFLPRVFYQETRLPARNPPIWNRKMVNGVVFFGNSPGLFCFWQSFFATKVLFTNHMKHYNGIFTCFQALMFLWLLETQGNFTFFMPKNTKTQNIHIQEVWWWSMVVLEVVKQNWLHMSALGPWNMTWLCFQDGFERPTNLGGWHPMGI